MSMHKSYLALVVWILLVAPPAVAFRTAVPLGSLPTSLKAPNLGHYMDADSRFEHSCRCQQRRPTTVITTATTTTQLYSYHTTASATQQVLYMSLLATQFAIQPLLTKRYCPKSLIKSLYVLSQDVIRTLLCFALLQSTGSWSTAVAGWNWKTTLATAGLPAILYCIQNYASLVAYQNLTPLQYNVLNQTKTLSAALWCYLLLGLRQSKLQMVALVLLVVAAVVMQHEPAKTKTVQTQQSTQATEMTKDGETPDAFSSSSCIGFIAIWTASMISGLAGAWCQQSLQGVGGRNALLFSMELASMSALILVVTLVLGVTDDARQLRESKNRFASGWTAGTLLPLITNAFGGILVGLVTKHVGAVPKGFALIVGMFASGVLQNFYTATAVQRQQWVGGVLAAVSLYLHASHPLL